MQRITALSRRRRARSSRSTVSLSEPPGVRPVPALPALLIAFAMLGKLWREGGQLVAERGTS
jgi:hypothetical protein